MEYKFPLFNDIINSEMFESLATSEKIQLLLKKDVFFLKNSLSNKKFYCQDFSQLDFTICEKLDFSFLETYEINGMTIVLNPLVAPEVLEGICNEIRSSLTTTSLIGELNFNLSLLRKRKEKEKYLRAEIDKKNPYGFDALFIEYDRGKNKITLSPYVLNEIVLYNPQSIRKWITGENYPGSEFVYSDPYLDNFYLAYQNFIMTEYCFNEIIKIKNHSNEKKSLSNTMTLNIESAWQKEEPILLNATESENISETNNLEKHSHIFKRNAFEVWQSMFDSFEINESKRSDVKFIYEVMKKDGLIFKTVNQTTFLDWIFDTYDILIQKTSNFSETSERKAIYSTAKQLYKMQGT